MNTHYQSLRDSLAARYGDYGDIPASELRELHAAMYEQEFGGEIAPWIFSDLDRDRSARAGEVLRLIMAERSAGKKDMTDFMQFGKRAKLWIELENILLNHLDDLCERDWDSAIPIILEPDYDQQAKDTRL